MSRRRRVARQPAKAVAPMLNARSTSIERRRSAAAALVMCALVVAVYLPVRSNADDNTLFSSDYHQLHSRRIQFAQQAILTTGSLPAWYPRELMGTPYWSNVQNFPFIPSRLALLWMNPLDLITAGVVLAAVLSALFTFCFARSIDVGRVGAAVAGWTFACAGFFAARVMAGHLPLLEAYPALPLLLWRVEMCVGEGHESTGRRLAMRLAALALAVCCALLAGHPQLPAYAVGVAGPYVLYRGWRRRTLMCRAAMAMALGAGMAAFALWPMLLLIRRSTRMLALDPAVNDLALPYRRLGAMLFPWQDGWPVQVVSTFARPFAGYGGGEAVFWDTVCYVGWLPLMSLVAIAIWRLRRARRSADGATDRPRSSATWIFLLIVGATALLLALPAAQQVSRLLPGTILRSPARLLYITTFVLAIATGLAIDGFVRSRRRSSISAGQAVGGGWIAVTVLVAVLAIHFLQLTWHDRSFIRMTNVATLRDLPFEDTVRQFVGDGRVGIDYRYTLPLNREVDDVGFFESIMLAKPYAALLDLSGVPATTNVQHVSGSEMPARALAAMGTRLVITATRERPDLPLVSGSSPVRSYAVPGALPRASFLPESAVLRADSVELHRRLRDPSHDLATTVMLPSPAATELVPATIPSTHPAPPGVAYERRSTDEIVLRTEASDTGVVRVLESWDPGWRVTVDGAPAEVLCADDVFLAVAVPAGTREVKFRFSTPGAVAGAGITFASVGLLAALLASTALRRSATTGASDAG